MAEETVVVKFNANMEHPETKVPYFAGDVVAMSPANAQAALLSDYTEEVSGDEAQNAQPEHVPLYQRDLNQEALEAALAQNEDSPEE